nr:chaperone protein DnaJ 1, mitochondrial isoform X2 [Ipomoea batatas]
MSGSSSSNGGGGFGAKFKHFLYSGDKKHVVAGMAIIGSLFGVPWYFMNRGNGDLELEGNAELRLSWARLSSKSFVQNILSRHRVVAESAVEKRVCHSAEKDYYDLLGVSKDASREEIKKAFHALAKEYHLDANKNNPSTRRKFQ